MKALKILACIALLLTSVSCNKGDIIAVSDFMNFSWTGEVQMLGMNVTKDWTISSTADWCTVNPKNGAGTAKDVITVLEVKCTTNRTGDQRQCALIIKAGDVEREVTIRQGIEYK